MGRTRARQTATPGSTRCSTRPLRRAGWSSSWRRRGFQLARYGLKTLKDAVASGQYDYPNGLFFGGHGPSASQKLLAEYLPELFGGAEHVTQLDLHTGMGKWCTYSLNVDLPGDSHRTAELRAAFGDRVQGLTADGVLYVIHGALGPWLEEQVPSVRYDTMLAEFGTYNVVRVLRDLRWENRAFRYAPADKAMRAEAAKRIVEVFCPASEQWRTSCVEQALGLVQTAMAKSFGAPEG